MIGLKYQDLEEITSEGTYKEVEEYLDQLEEAAKREGISLVGKDNEYALLNSRLTDLMWNYSKTYVYPIVRDLIESIEKRGEEFKENGVELLVVARQNGHYASAIGVNNKKSAEGLLSKLKESVDEILDF